MSKNCAMCCPSSPISEQICSLRTPVIPEKGPRHGQWSYSARGYARFDDDSLLVFGYAIFDDDSLLVDTPTSIAEKTEVEKMLKTSTISGS